MKVFDASGQFLGYLLAITSYTQYQNYQPLGTGYKWDIYVPGLQKIVPIVQDSGQVAKVSALSEDTVQAIVWCDKTPQHTHGRAPQSWQTPGFANSCAGGAGVRRAA
jgi:hypothetical protein